MQAIEKIKTTDDLGEHGGGIWKKCGKSVYGWTANTSGAMLRIVNCGADGVITDDVRLLQTFLREQACRKAFASVY